MAENITDQKFSETQALENSNPVKILIVDKDEVFGHTLAELLHANGFSVFSADTAWEAFEKILDINLDVIISDADMPGTSCTEFIRYCKKHHPLLEIIITSKKPDVSQAVRAIKDGAFDYTGKSQAYNVIVQKITEAHLYQINHLVKTITAGAEDEISSRLINPLPGYELLQKLGSGSSGVVLLVKQGNQKFALKILRWELYNDKSGKTQIDRFLREAEILAKIEHPNVVKIFSSGLAKNGGVPYILMEYIRGRTLKDYITESSFSFRRKTKTLLQICNALSAIHKHGILHRDIKPGNIIIQNDLVVKLADFGIARTLDSNMTMTMEIIGSPAYMAPESFANSKDTDQRSDIFSLGVLAYELYTGKKPFHGSSMSEIIYAIKNEKPVEPKKISSNLPGEAQMIMAKMLAKKPEERFQSIDEIIPDLENLLNRTKNKDSLSDTHSKGLLARLLGDNSSKYWA
jgi:DNA-binding NarL/FixJ family response regulator